MLSEPLLGWPWSDDLTLNTIIFGPPRKILLLIFWNVGENDSVFAAFVISIGLALLTAWIYTGVAEALCGKRSLAAKSAASKRLNNGSLVADGKCSSKSANLWTVHNKRYDLQGFVAKHPGGVDAISLGQGFNCTELFESYHSLANEKLVRATLAQYYVEDAPHGAADYDMRFDWSHTPFYTALKSRVRAHFQQQHGRVSSCRASGMQWLQLICAIIASVATLYGFMCGSLLSMILLPFCYWWGPSSCMHDGGHFSLSRRPWVNCLLAHIGGAHMSMFSWYHQHTIGHHVNTNMPGYDPDLYHFTALSNKNPGFRTSVELCSFPENVGGYTRSQWWRLGMWLRVPLATFGPSVIWDMNSLSAGVFEQAFLGLVPYRQKWMDGLQLHSIGRSIIIWLAIIHPITVSLTTASNWLAGAVYAFFFVIIPYAIHGCIFYAFSQVSHVQQECSHITPEEQAAGIKGNDQKPREWALQQVEHTLDYAIGSTFWLHVSNGLNLQVVHHLFPQVGWGHYVQLAPIIREVCADFNVVYATKSSFWEALASHYSYLVSINDGPNASLWVQSSPGQASPETLRVLGQFDAVRAAKKKP
jgi:fatty acid desaturase